MDTGWDNGAEAMHAYRRPLIRLDHCQSTTQDYRQHHRMQHPSSYATSIIVCNIHNRMQHPSSYATSIIVCNIHHMVHVMPLPTTWKRARDAKADPGVRLPPPSTTRPKVSTENSCPVAAQRYTHNASRYLRTDRPRSSAVRLIRI